MKKIPSPGRRFDYAMAVAGVVLGGYGAAWGAIGFLRLTGHSALRLRYAAVAVAGAGFWWLTLWLYRRIQTSRRGRV